MKEIRAIIAEGQRRTGERLALATLVRAHGSSYRRPGARMLMASDRKTVGVLSGGCLEEEVAECAQEVIATGRARLLTFDTRLRYGCNGSIEIFGHQTFLQVADPPIGVLFLLAMSSIGIYGAMLAGWASGSKYPLLGSVRASASMISYEAALGLSVVTVVLLSGSLTTHDIVASQASAGRIVDWNIIATALVPFVIFCIAATAELNRPPFDFAEAEQELVAGFHTEYSSMRFGMFYLAEFMNTITMSAIIITLFLGGPSGPVLFGPHNIWPFIWFLLKLLVFLGAFVWVRGTVPRYRYDQLMDLGWKRLIPVALLWLLLIAGIKIGRDQDWNVVVVPAVGIAVGLAVAGLLGGAMRTARLRRDELGDELGEVTA